ncbi:hypothetical protein ACHMW6_06070 [Pseudoduganella sp. UC29_106]|uniref:hypothetical protein n=1 Tax=Pseudoduganella sp. UC29_106 TaxID=3374553 RepID=UPI0037573C45
MANEISKVLEDAEAAISMALGKALNEPLGRSKNGKLRIGLLSEQHRLASLLLKLRASKRFFDHHGM